MEKSKSPRIGKTEGELYLLREELFSPQSDSQIKERKVSPKASKVNLRFFSIPGSFTFIPKDVFSLGCGSSTYYAKNQIQWLRRGAANLHILKLTY